MEIAFLIPAFLQGLGIVALVSISYDILLHQRIDNRVRSFLVALIFTGAVAGTMSLPIAVGAASTSIYVMFCWSWLRPLAASVQRCLRGL